MRALYCLLWKKWKNHLLQREKSFCKLAGRKCLGCAQCVWKEIEEDVDG